MVHVYLENIYIYAYAALFLKKMFNPRSTFYALSVAWDFSDKVPIVHGHLPLQFSYNDSRKYKGKPLAIFEGQHICGALNLMVFAYQFEEEEQKHEKFLHQLEEDVLAIFTKQSTQMVSKENVNIWQKSITKELNICINNTLKQEDLDIINIFEGLVDIDNTFPTKQKSTIKHYYKTGGIELSVRV